MSCFLGLLAAGFTVDEEQAPVGEVGRVLEVANVVGESVGIDALDVIERITEDDVVTPVAALGFSMSCRDLTPELVSEDGEDAFARFDPAEDAAVSLSEGVDTEDDAGGFVDMGFVAEGFSEDGPAVFLLDTAA